MFLIPYNSYTDILDVETHGVLPMMLVSASVLFVVTQRSARPRSAGWPGRWRMPWLPALVESSHECVARKKAPFAVFSLPCGRWLFSSANGTKVGEFAS